MRLVQNLVTSFLALQISFVTAQTPEVQKLVIPSYPRLLRVARIHGAVKFHLAVAKGVITSITVAESADTPPLVKKHAYQSIEKWVFNNCFSGEREIEFRFILTSIPWDSKEFEEDSEVKISPNGLVTITGRVRTPEPVKLH